MLLSVTFTYYFEENLFRQSVFVFENVEKYISQTVFRFRKKSLLPAGADNRDTIDMIQISDKRTSTTRRTPCWAGSTGRPWLHGVTRSDR